MLYLKKLREEKNVSQADVARSIGVSRQTYNNYELGKREADYETLLKLAEYFGTTVEKILVGKEKIIGLNILEHKNIRMIPLYKSVSAGFGTHADDYVIGYEPVYIESDYDAENSLAIVVEGDSMYPKIEHGDIIIVRKQSDFDNGDIIVAIPLDGMDNGFVKRAFLSKDKLVLESINNSYPPMEFEDEEINNIHVVGVVKKIIKTV